MVMEAIPVQSIWKLVRLVPGLFLRRYFTRERLANLIYVDMVPRGDQATIDLGAAPYFSLHLQIINLSPYPVELDRASFQFYIAGQEFNAAALKRKIIAPGEIATLYLRETIPDGHANRIAQSIGPSRNRAELDGNIEFNCKLHSFPKTVGHLTGINCDICNAQNRTKPA